MGDVVKGQSDGIEAVYPRCYFDTHTHSSFGLDRVKYTPESADNSKTRRIQDRHASLTT